MVAFTVGLAVATEDVRHFRFSRSHRGRCLEVLRCSKLQPRGIRLWKQIQRTGGGAHRNGCDSQVSLRGRKATMTEEQLNCTNIVPSFKEMDREGVP